MRALNQLLQSVVIAIQVLHLHFDHAIYNKDQVVCATSSFVNKVTPLKYLFMHEKLKFVEELLITHVNSFLEVVNLLKQFNFEFNPLIIIESLYTVFHDIIKSRVIVPKVVKLLLGQLGKNAVVKTLNGGSPGAVVNEAYLSKVVARLDLQLLVVFTHVISNRHLTFSSRNETKELVVRVVLLAKDIFRQLEPRGDLVYQELHHLPLVLKKSILADGRFENVLRHLAP